ncbi:LOB domain-containing protein 11-like [Rhodamnia argentea]|uniref:LOB domain-containing protein 11-like n=1 Tax=Rhodamnia argentea TaxID=178133 RepID=A0A8B8R542_9MYRT|nr:LOB domain-containing protein 11-like [Rhodamnia argentea]
MEPSGAGASSASPPSPIPPAWPCPTPALPLPVVVVASPCAACKALRRRCSESCVLAPYFPPSDPAKFAIAHRVFGASNIVKSLLALPESQRDDAVSSMIYEAGTRIRDPVYGCAGAISQLQTQISQLQAQLAKSEAELMSMQVQLASLVEQLQLTNSQDSSSHQSLEILLNSPFDDYQIQIDSCFDEYSGFGSFCEPLWT